MAHKLLQAGVTDIELMDDGFRDSVEEVENYTKTSKDLLIKGWPFEVKSRSLAFSGPDDWPSWAWPMFVDTVSSLDSKDDPPVGYIFVSQKTNAIMSASVSLKYLWQKQDKYDNARGIWDRFYCVRRGHVLNEQQTIEKLLRMPHRE